MDVEKGSFYLGGRVEPDAEKRGEPVLYDSDDLVTHGVIVGMTGSGKTGLGVDLLEEALRSDIPCLIIDPKGDMGNLALMFPNFAPADFAPWVDPGEAERQGVTIDELGASTATMWQEGLAGWDIDGERLRAVKDNTALTIYTPGSKAGVPLDILGSLAAPDLSWDTHAEELRDEIEGFVSSLLVLAGIDSDPVSGPEHILLATIIEKEWRAGNDLDLARLVGAIGDPPFRKLGVFELDDFFPKAKRQDLAMRLNGLLASPSFAGWLEGEPLDIETILTGGDKTNAAIVYLAHLGESERQFVVTLLLAKLTTWMRRQSGTGQLRALVYMDEVFGFAPPVAEPPSKKQILTILKQARAFGVGMVLSTQNPVDLDYKAMSNAGTWMIGRLQTENDKARILEGLTDVGGATDVDSVDTLISNLDKRQFVLRQTGKAEPTVFGTRWAMSYLAGPLDKSRVTRLVGASQADATAAADPTPPPPAPTEQIDASEAPAATLNPPVSEATTPPLDDDTFPVAPQVDDSITVAYLDPAAPWAASVGAMTGGSRWRAIGVATVHLLFDDRYAEVDHQEDFEAIIDPLGEAFSAESVRTVDHDLRDFKVGPSSEGTFELLPDGVKKASYWTGLASDLKDHLVRSERKTVWKNEVLKIYSRLGETEEAFRARCGAAADDAADADIAKLKDRYETKIDRVRDQITRADNRVAELDIDKSSRSQTELVSGAVDLLGAVLGGKSVGSAIKRAASRRSQTTRTGADLATAKARLTEEENELVELQEEFESEILEISAAWEAKAEDLSAIDIPLESGDVDVAEVKLVWIPT